MELRKPMPPLAKGKPAQTPTTLQVDVRELSVNNV
jgi:hypothetical protein